MNFSDDDDDGIKIFTNTINKQLYIYRYIYI